MRNFHRSRPLIIAAAINGAGYSAHQYPQIPVTASQAVTDAVKSHEAGAAYIHFHAREPRSGGQFADLGWFRNVRDEMAILAPDAVISLASSLKGLVANQIQSSIATARLFSPELSNDRLIELQMLRAIGMDANPDLMTIFTALETKILGGDDDAQEATRSYAEDTTKIFSDPALITAYYQRAMHMYAARNIIPEYEITTMGALWKIELLARKQWIPRRPHFIFLFGFSSRLPISRQVFDLSMAFVRYLRSQYGVDPVVSVGSVMEPRIAAFQPRAMGEPLEAEKHDYIQLLEWTLEDETPDAIRVGLEDTPSHFGENACNAGLVTLIKEECEKAGIAITRDPAFVHALFGIRR